MDNVKKSHTEDNKRLAKNTVALYVRNAVTMPVALYVSRVLLKMLGVAVNVPFYNARQFLYIGSPEPMYISEVSPMKFLQFFGNNL